MKIIHNSDEDCIDHLPKKLSKKDPKCSLLQFPIDHYGTWSRDLSLRREDMYGDNGR